MPHRAYKTNDRETELLYRFQSMDRDTCQCKSLFNGTSVARTREVDTRCTDTRCSMDSNGKFHTAVVHATSDCKRKSERASLDREVLTLLVPCTSYLVDLDAARAP